jgi:hypothetical protein
VPAYRLSDTYSVPPAGLTFITSTTFSAASSVSVDGCFTASFTNYSILWDSIGSSAGNATQMRMRASSTDDTSANYSAQNVQGSGAGVTAARYTAQTFMYVVVNDTSRDYAQINVYGPNLARPTLARTTSASSLSSGFIQDWVGLHNISTAYDGFTLYPAAGTFTGSLWVYGYRSA